jgi:hypothetical protein
MNIVILINSIFEYKYDIFFSIINRNLNVIKNINLYDKYEEIKWLYILDDIKIVKNKAIVFIKELHFYLENMR